MIQQFGFQDFINRLIADQLPTDTQCIAFDGSWAQIVNGSYDGSVGPVRVVGAVIRHQLKTGIPIIPSSDLEAYQASPKQSVKRPPLLPLNMDEVGYYTLDGLGEYLRVHITDLFQLYRTNMTDWLQQKRGNTRWFGVFYHKTPNADQVHARNEQTLITTCNESGVLFRAGENIDKGVEFLLLGLWEQLISNDLPWYRLR